MFSRNKSKFFWIIILIMLAIYYYAVSFLFNPAISKAELQFNNMLQHLLHGQFDIDADVVGNEGYERLGRVYAYWGIVPALLRIVLLPLPGWQRLDVTATSSAIAAALCAWWKLRALAEIRNHLPDSPTRALLFAVLGLSVVVGGALIPFLRVSIYQEVVFWAAAFGAGFVLCCVRGLLRPDGFSTGRLSAMAAFATLALLTRVSVGLGLYVALGLLILWLAGRRGGLLQRRIVPSALLLCSGAGIAGVINQVRFGSPFLFVNMHIAKILTSYPDRLARLEQYGQFNIARLWYGLVYYFVPIWLIVRSDGNFLFAESDQRLMDATELPASSFLLTDPIQVVLFAFGVLMLFWSFTLRNRIDRGAAVTLLVGLAMPPFLLLIAISFNFRYRMDFQPLFDLGACLGFLALGLTRPEPARSLRLWTWGGTLVGVVAAHVMLLLNLLSPFGPARDVVAEAGFVDWTHFYFWTGAHRLGF